MFRENAFCCKKNMNENSYLRRGLIKGVFALVGSLFFLKLTRFGFREAPERAEANNTVKRVSGPVQHGLEGVSVGLRGEMFGTGKKLG